MRFKGKKPIASYKDTWDLKTSLAPIIAEGLRKFLEVIKSTDYGGYPYGFETPEDWYAVLEKMIFSFENIDTEIEPEGDYGQFRWRNQDSSKTFSLNIERTPEQQAVWDKYLEDSCQFREQVQEGLDLFSKYYGSLWW